MVGKGFSWFSQPKPTVGSAAVTTISTAAASDNNNAEEGPLMSQLRALELRSESQTPSETPSPAQPSTPQDELTFQFPAKMPTSSPINIATTRNSSSPVPQGPKNSQFLEPDSRTSAAMMTGGYDSSMGASFTGAKPISMNNPNRNGDGRPRRESLAGSLAGGMSWGGVSVGSWIRDDIMMTGTSPFPMQSPSYHSASYMPKLEANFMKDFSCCGQNLPTLHDLLQHYEECHAQQTPQSMRTTAAAQRARDNPTSNSKSSIAPHASSVQQQAHQQQNNPNRPTGLQIPQGAPPVGGISLLRQQPLSQPATPVQRNVQTLLDDGMDGVEDMEMDDAMGPMDQNPNTPIQSSVQGAQQSLFGQQQRPQLNLNASGMGFNSALRTSQPPTPAATGYGFQHNPTVSSVNTPALSTHPMQQTQNFSPHTSVPGTPGELDDDYTSFPMNLNMGTMTNQQQYPYGYNDLGVELCIDEPARRLYQPNGGGQQSQRAMQQQFAQFGLSQGQFDSNSDLIRQMQMQQQQAGMMGGLTANQAIMAMMEEHKPFRCPVVGCEKAYKNQNGLKYHKAHGHQTQQLHENGDGTFSIVNPETSAPYPGEAGMAKEKPYRCETCGKRYKNLNGLKYHKQHSAPCNPELKLSSILQLGGLSNVNVAGLPGIGEDVMM